jgi:hypothetical protein
MPHQENQTDKQEVKTKSSKRSSNLYLFCVCVGEVVRRASYHNENKTTNRIMMLRTALLVSRDAAWDLERGRPPPLPRGADRGRNTHNATQCDQARGPIGGYRALGPLKHDCLMIFEASEGLGGSGGAPGAPPRAPPSILFFRRERVGDHSGALPLHLAAHWHSRILGF